MAIMQPCRSAWRKPKKKLTELVKAGRRAGDDLPPRGSPWPTLCARNNPITRSARPGNFKRTGSRYSIPIDGSRSRTRSGSVSYLAEVTCSDFAQTAERAFRLCSLPHHCPEPFDRQIVAQALSKNLAVATPDESSRYTKD